MRTQVIIVGGGPSGLLLSQLLNRAGVATIVLERQSRDYVLGRIRAGVLEHGTVELLRKAGAGARMEAEGHFQDGCYLAHGQQMFRLDFTESCRHQVMIYGQSEVTRDLYAAQDAIGATHIHGVQNVALHDLQTDAPFVTYEKDGQRHRIDGDFIAGCDGFHGVSRASIPEGDRREYEKVYPFSWLGVLSRTPPLMNKLVMQTTRAVLRWPRCGTRTCRATTFRCR